MGKLPSLALARLIVRSYRFDDFHPLCIYGDLRIGKSVYYIKALEQACQYLFGVKELDYDLLTRFMGWKPEENVDIWLEEEERQPTFGWDDAGYWLHSLKWNDPVLISIQQYMNVVGTDYNTLGLTTPDPTWILSKIANMPGMVRIRIVKRDGGKRDTKTKMFSRLAIGYKPWRSPDLKRGGVNKVLKDKFSCYLRDDLYDLYKPIRDKYSKEAKLEIKKNLMLQKQEKDIRELATIRRLRNLEKKLWEKVKGKDVTGLLGDEGVGVEQ